MTGPVEGGIHGWAFGATTLDLRQWEYVQEEYLLEGRARPFRLRPGTTMEPDGRWQAEPLDPVPYRTRIVVLRPLDADRFNGTVVIHWNNVSAGYDLVDDSIEVLESGSSLVAVTTQHVGVQGLPPMRRGLAHWDPGRYKSLEIPNDDLSFDIFTQAALAVGPERRHRGVDPMAGLPVRTLVGEGSSQSAGRLATYANALQPMEPVFDAFLLLLYFGTATPLDLGDTVVNLADGSYEERRRQLLRGAHRIRDDAATPVMIVNSELEAAAVYHVRQPDTPSFRLWEAAGTAHTSRPSQLDRSERHRRDGIPTLAPPEGMNNVSLTPLFEAARHHVRRWAQDGTPPPIQPRIDIEGDPPLIVRDELGLATGGIRLPQVEVPLAVHSAAPMGVDVVSWLSGSSRPLTEKQLAARYPDRATYQHQFEEAAHGAVGAGVLLPRDAEIAIATARAEEILR